MFSGFELTVIKSWAAVGKDLLKDQLNSSIFTHSEKEDKRREYAALDSVIEETKRIQTEYVNVDADHLGHLLGVCSKYQEYIREQVDTAEMSTLDYAAEMYQIGYMQGRAELGLLTEDDMGVIMEWEDTLE